MNKNLTKSTRLLLELADFAGHSFDCLDAFLMSASSASQLKRNMKMVDDEYNSAFQGLIRHGYIEKINENQFLIKPKGVRKAKLAQLEARDWTREVWDGFWRIISFDIPERLRVQRDTFRSILKRLGFIGIQNSVFIAPFADFEALAELRENLGIEKYVSFFVSKSYSTDDDSSLRKRFGLK